MKVDALLNHFKSHRMPMVAAAAGLGIHPETIKKWVANGGIVPVKWAYMAKELFGLALNKNDYKP